MVRAGVQVRAVVRVVRPLDRTNYSVQRAIPNVRSQGFYSASLSRADMREGKRYVPEKEYIHMISSYITADWSNIE